MLFPQGDRQVLPVHEVAAHLVAPSHVSPRVAEAGVLIEQVVFAAEIDEAVRVVRPVRRRSKMKLGSLGFLVKPLAVLTKAR